MSKRVCLRCLHRLQAIIVIICDSDGRDRLRGVLAEIAAMLDLIDAFQEVS